MAIRWMQNNVIRGLLCLTGLVAMDLVHASDKKGVAVCKEYYECEDLDQFTSIAWWYDWGNGAGYHTNKYGCTNPLKGNRIPMVSKWAVDEPTPRRFYFKGQSEYMIGFNEPNHNNQANMSPQYAVTRWRELETVAEGNGAIYYVSPSATPGGDTDYIEWFDQFFELCTDCQVDFLATHFFSWNCDAAETMTFLTELWERYNKKIWLTEFACPRDTVDVDDQIEYMTELLPQLEAAEFVDRYSWFCTRISVSDRYVKPSASLLEPDEATLTELGEFYNNFEPSS